jgi:hypothetical protein
MRGIALRQVLILRQPPRRLGAALLIVSVAFAGAALLHHHVFGGPLGGFDLGFHPVHPWWVDAATVALCLLGTSGAADVLGTTPGVVVIGYAAASVLFLAAGVAVIADKWLMVFNTAGLLGRTNLGVALLLLSLVAAVLFGRSSSRLRR